MIRKFFSCEYVIPVGSGTVGLYLALKAIDVRHKKVLIPASTCPSVAIAVFAAGGKPVAVDVSYSDYNISSESVEDAMDTTVRAIIAVDAFGYPADIQKLKSIASPYECIVIEDACQAYGGKVGDRIIGNRADVGVISVGSFKSIDVKVGGFLLTNSRDFLRKVNHIRESPDFDILRNEKHKFANYLMDKGKNKTVRFLSSYLGLLRYNFPTIDEQYFAKRWKEFEAEIEPLRTKLNIVKNLISSIHRIELFDYEIDSWLPWRYSFKVPDLLRKQEILKEFQEVGIRTTQLYRPITEHFCDIDVSNSLKYTMLMKDGIVNLCYKITIADVDLLIDKLMKICR